MLPAPVVLFWKCQPDYVAQNNAPMKRDPGWRKIYEVLAARMGKFITVRARKNKRTARMHAETLNDHSISLELASVFHTPVVLLKMNYVMTLSK